MDIQVNLKPILDKFLHVRNFARSAVQTRAKLLVEQTKTNPLVEQYLDAVVESEKTTRALKILHERFGDVEVLQTLEKFRRDFLERRSLEKSQSPSKVTTPEEVSAGSKKVKETLTSNEPELAKNREKKKRAPRSRTALSR